MSTLTKRASKRSVAAVMATAMLAALLAVVTPAGATPTVSATTRISGDDRYATANKVANTPATTTQTKFVIASGESFADGLAASALAGAQGANLLLTDGGDSVPTAVLTQLTTMTAGVAAGTAINIAIIGGTAAVPAGQSTQLAASGYTVARHSGDDRYATADAVAAQVKVQNGGNIGTFGAYRTAFLAVGTNFADAISASGYAYYGKHPIYLTDGTTLSAGTSAAMKAQKVQHVIILGGTAAISDAVATDALGVSTVVSTQRVDGTDRYDTAAKLATVYKNVVSTFRNSVVLVSGTTFADGIAASQYASDETSVILPVTDPMPAAISSYLTTNNGLVSTIATVGGLSAVSAATVTAAKTAATVPALSGTITAKDGSLTYTVTFSDGVDATTRVQTSCYSANNILGTAVTVSSVAYSAVLKTATVTLASALAAGTVVRVNGACVLDDTVAGLYVGAASATVVKDTSAPTATITAVPKDVSAHAAHAIVITFSTNTKMSTFAAADITIIPAVLGATAATVDNCAAFGTWTQECDLSGGGTDLSAGDTIKIAAAKFTSNATTPVNNAAVTGTVTADIVAPKLNSVSYTVSSTHLTAVQADLALWGDSFAAQGAFTTQDITITAKGSGAAGGASGNSWSTSLVAGLAEGVVVSTLNKTIAITVIAGTSTSATIANTLNNNAAFIAVASASGTQTTAMVGAEITERTAGVTAALAKLGGGNGTDGKSRLTMTATFSEPLTVAAAANFTSSLGTCTEAVTANAVTNAGLNTGVITVTCEPTTNPVSGVATLTAATAIKDYAQNAVSAAASANVVVMYAG